MEQNLRRKEMPENSRYKSVAGILKFCTIIAVIGAVTAFMFFCFSLLAAANNKGPIFSGVLTLAVLYYAILSRRAYITAAAQSIPKMRQLVIVTIFNLAVLGLPVSFFGFLAIFFGFGTMPDGVAYSYFLVFLGCCAILFFVSHIMTLVAAHKIRKLSRQIPLNDLKS